MHRRYDWNLTQQIYSMTHALDWFRGVAWLGWLLRQCGSRSVSLALLWLFCRVIGLLNKILYSIFLQSKLLPKLCKVLHKTHIIWVFQPSLKLWLCWVSLRLLQFDCLYSVSFPPNNNLSKLVHYLPRREFYAFSVSHSRIVKLLDSEIAFLRNILQATYKVEYRGDVILQTIFWHVPGRMMRLCWWDLACWL